MHEVAYEMKNERRIKHVRACAAAGSLRDGIPFAAIARFNIRLTDTVRTAITHISHRPWARPPTPHDHFSSVTSCTNDYDEHVAFLLSSETFEFRLPHANT